MAGGESENSQYRAEEPKPGTCAFHGAQQTPPPSPPARPTSRESQLRDHLGGRMQLEPQEMRTGARACPGPLGWHLLREQL